MVVFFALWYLTLYADPTILLIGSCCLAVPLVISPICLTLLSWEMFPNHIGRSPNYVDRSWGYAMFFPAKGYRESESKGVTEMVAFSNIWSMTGLLLDRDACLLDYSQAPMLDTDEDCSDVFDLIGFRSDDGKRRTFKWVWDKMEDASKEELRLSRIGQVRMPNVRYGRKY
jgi:hypothetical protein